MMANNIAEFSREASRRYLQSAVFIDDKIYDRSTATLAVPDDFEIKRLKPVIRGQSAKAEIPVEPSNEPAANAPFRTQDLIGSFAKQGIVCAPYEPEHNFSTDESSTVFRICETADLVILDWDFHDVGLAGDKPKDLISRLVKRGNAVAPHHVRLIVVYTTTPSLSKISSTLLDHLDSQSIPVVPNEGDCLRLQCGSSRLLVLGKPGTGRLEDEEKHVVEEKDLADRLLSEFAKMNEGLLPSCALLGMAAVRQNSRRILDKFSAKLDAQFLLHRALIKKSEDAFDQLPELLADEFRAVIEDSDSLPDNIEGLVSSVAEKMTLSQMEYTLGGENASEYLRKYVAGLNGYNSNTSTEKLWRRKRDRETTERSEPELKPHELASICSPEGQEHLEFGALLSGRTTYSENPRILRFGTVVREILSGSTDIFSVCLMPACDSIRLTNPVSFPFWILETEGGGHAQCVQFSSSVFPQLVLRGKICKQLWLEQFQPDSLRKVVVFDLSEDKHTITTIQKNDIPSRKFEWVSQLKPAHAQRLAHAVGQAFSRVGLTEAEWLRLAHT